MTDETQKSDAEIMAELKAEAIAKAQSASAKYDAKWSADRIEAAAVGAMEAKKKAEAAALSPAAPVKKAEPPAEDQLVRGEVMNRANELGLDLEDMKARPLDDVLSIIGKRTIELKQAQRKPEIDPGRVVVRVLKNGDQKFSKGIHVPGVGDLNYVRGDELEVPRRTAEALEAKGWVEIL